MAVAHLRSFLEDGRSPSPHPDTLPVANRMAAPAAPAEARLGAAVGKGMRVEPGFLRWAAVLRTEVWIRILEIVLCLISFSVMAAGKTRGWDGDSFDRYQEYRYCLSMNVLAFAYAMFQVYSHFYHRMKRMHIISRPLSYYFDFCMDQATSSSAATRNDEWVAMFGSDGFTDRMGGSIAISFLAFFAFACSCIISAYKLFSMGL
ncbi:hypothetical protein HPP92_009698 [Vanilla planifolia]|uniref:CASP-like protein n=1 Tax=Vanilla planifolia TaxID=51239 RepID=A0A835V336_VANPL|nr:hypothetical protein HPP92_009698 [Vanilla planifolia]